MTEQTRALAQGMLRTQEIMCAADMEAKIAALAHRFWSIHPSSLDDMGLTREEFYASEIRKLLALRTPAEGERQRCMEILEDVPGETLVDRVNRLKDWHQELSNSYHDAIAEARTERDQAVSQVENARAQAIEEAAALMQRWSDEAAEFKNSPRCEIQMNVCRNAATAIRNRLKQPSTSRAEPTPDAPHVSQPAVCECGYQKPECTVPYCPK